MRALGRYQILKPLGRGGAGGVFLAKDQLRGGQEVALKRIHAHSDQLLRASFEREFSVLASLALRGVARVLDFGLAEPDGDDPGGPFFTRAFVDGEPLTDALADAKPERRIAAVRSVAHVIAPLHRMGICHGDLKPANVLLDRRGQAHVIDFGLAGLTTDRARPGGAGTPSYMAPELLRGAPPSVMGDVYALGATLFELLAGAPPFAELGARGVAERLEGKLPTIPKGLGETARRGLEVALRALAPDPLARTSAALDLAAALTEILGDGGEPRADAFVSPRPRGHEDVLAQLDARATARLAGQGGEQTALVVHGGSGVGKTTLLRELKWRQEVRGVPVVELDGAPHVGLAPIDALVRAARLLGGGDVPEEDLRALDEVSRLRFLERVLGELGGRGPCLVLVDDADRLEPFVGRALRHGLHADGASRICLVAAVDAIDAPAIRELGAHHVVPVPSLSEDDVAALAREAVFTLDAPTVRALHRQTRGVAGAVAEALAALSSIAAPTAADVAKLPAGAAGERAARARLAPLSAEARRVLELATAACAPLPVAVVTAVLGVAESAVSECIREDLLLEVGDGVALSDRAVAAIVEDDLGEDARRELVQKALRHPRVAKASAATRARLALEAGDDDAIRSLAPAAAAALESEGAIASAIEMVHELARRAKGAERRTALLSEARLAHALGRYERSIHAAHEARGDEGASAEDRALASVAAGRSWVAAGEFDRAVGELSEVPEGASAGVRAMALRELAKVHLRRGDYAAVDDVVGRGLALSANDDPVRIELLTAGGSAASYRGDKDAGRARFGEALSLARSLGSRRDEANVLTFMAIDRQRNGDHTGARDLYERSLEIARELGDVGSMATFSLNLGAVSYELGLPAKAAEHYEAAARLARRAGRATTDVMARTNLAQLHLYLGLYERARVGADSALADAESAGMRPSAAQCIALLGDVAARTGDVETALVRYDDATARYRALGQKREVAETLVDSAGALLDRGGPADGSAAVSRLAEAREIVGAAGLEEFRPRLRLFLARARAETGDADGATADLEALLADVRAASNRELEWQVLAALGQKNAIRGADFVARRQDQEAMEVLESIATRLPRDVREAFWHDPRRRDVRRRAGMETSSRPGSGAGRREVTSPGVGLEARTSRLLELIKRLASERDVDRLLERITDSAVELAGAERGFVLLVGSDGKLEARTVRDARATEADPHAAFSQSIAEAVLIDGEPIITIDARDDHRLSEYMSVHKLMLKSVACLPIRGQAGPVGVLYLEHRMRRGRFDEADVDLLFAFADQAAIALENARLIEEIEKKRRELETANAELARAKGDVERVLVARTAELEEAKLEVDRARAELRGTYERHGIVGASEAMRRVFAVVDRVREASIPVVIHGESGTGKELVARAIHYGGPRAKRPFVAINCAAIPEALLESELFGHVKGAFTGADRDRRGVLSQANGGTLFLDEVGDMPPKMQVDLLRVLQDGRVRPIGGEGDEAVDVRIIAASNRDLGKLVEQGKFREDLFYRLNVVEVRLPPLRDRPTDVPLLAEHFLMQFAKRDGVPAKRISRDALKRLAEHGLPGNVRQLEHVLLNAWVLVDGEVIEAEDLALDEGASATDLFALDRGRLAMAAADPQGRASRDVPQTYDDFKVDEKRRILEALESCGWNRVRAAKALGIPRRTFYRRLKEHGILI